MSDDLRDRIEDTIEAAYAQWEFEFEAHEDGNRAYVDPGPKDAFIAQAIIDDLDLHVVERVGAVHRIAGSWTEIRAFGS